MLRPLIVSLAMVFPLCAVAQSDASGHSSDVTIAVSRNAQDTALPSPFKDLARSTQPKTAAWYNPLQKLGLRNKSKAVDPVAPRDSAVAKQPEAANPATSASSSSGFLAKLLKQDSETSKPRFRPFAKWRARDGAGDDPATEFTLGGAGSSGALTPSAEIGLSYNSFLGSDLKLGDEDASSPGALSLLQSEEKPLWPGQSPSTAYGPASRGHGIDAGKESPPMTPLGIKLRF
ncbi:MAG: hypothetical protein AB3N15_12010 [Paracoccaceae bacterium]